MPYGISNSTGQPAYKEVSAILDAAGQAGIRILDTARAYGNSMELIGQYHHESGATFAIISKFHGDRLKTEEVEQELELLNIPAFEAYLFHSFADFENAPGAILEALLKLKQKKQIRNIGVSVYGNEQFEKAISSDSVDLIQLPYNLLDNNHQRGKLLKYAKERNKEIHVRSTFLQGLFFMDPQRLPEKITPLKSHLEHIRQIAAKGKISLEELALGYALKDDRIDKVLIGVDSVVQLKKNLEAVKSSISLPDEIIREVDQIRVEDEYLLSPVNWK